MKVKKKAILKPVMLIAAAIVIIFVVLLFSLYLQISRYRAYWQKRASQTVPDNALVYVALGDSAAQSIGATSPDKGYVGLIAAELEQKYRCPVHVINISKSGTRVIDVLREQIPQLKNHKPDIITIEAGANDMSTFNEATFRSEMNELMAALPPQTVISDIPYYGGGRKRNLEVNAVAASRIISELAVQYGLKVAPLHEITKARDNLLTMSFDILHPSNRGYRNWYLAFAKPLELE